LIKNRYNIKIILINKEDYMSKLLNSLKNRRFFIICISFVLFYGTVYSLNDSFWSNRNSLDGAKAAYDYYKGAFGTNADYESAWKFARVAYFYGDNIVKDPAMKKDIFTEGKVAAEKATNFSAKQVEGHYYLGVCLGLWAEANGVLNSLFTAPDLLKEANKVIEIDPAFDNGEPYIFRGRIYNRAPAVISVGELRKSEADYLKGLEICQTKRVLYRFYAELLLDMGNRQKAKEMAAKGLAIAPDEENKVVDEKEMSLLKDLQKRL
jgi:tetratricopeptide (TPR) repeat protein